LQNIKTNPILPKSIIFIKKYYQVYGIIKSIRAGYHYIFRFFKKFIVSDLQKPFKINNYQMYLIPNDPGISKELSLFKSHEPINTKIISTFLEKGMTCIDIGGNIGYYVLLENQLIGKKGKVIAIEPLLQNFNYLTKNILLNNVNNVQIYNFACGDKNGKADFFINKKSNGCQVIRENTKPPNPSKGTISQVSVRILDDVITELNLDNVDFIRMDVEGYELNILTGLKKTLNKHKPIISLELHLRQLGLDGTKDFFQLMKDFEYEIESFIPRDLDIPFIGTMSDVRKPTIDSLLTMIESDKVGNYLMLNFVNSSKKLPRCDD